jgi:hypothetical protein
LQQPRLIQLCCNLAECIVSRGGRDGVWRAEPHTVKQVEGFGAEFEVESFRDRRPLEHRQVVVRDTRTAYHGIGAALIAESVCRRHRETAGIEPLPDSRLIGAGSNLVAAAPNGHVLEVFPNPLRDPLWDELFTGRPIVASGVVQLSEQPGFGFSINAQGMAKYTTRIC